MARDRTIFMAQREDEDENPILDRVDEGLMAEMEIGSGKNKSHDKHEHAHKRGNEKDSLGKVRGYDGPDQLDAYTRENVEKKMKKRRHRDDANSRSSEDMDRTHVMSVDLDSVGAECDEIAGKLKGSHELTILEETSIKVPEKKKNKKKWKWWKLESQEQLGTQIGEIEEEIAAAENQARAMCKDEKRRQKEGKGRARQSLEHVDAVDIVGGDDWKAGIEETVVEIPKKKRKFDKKTFRENLELPSSALKETPKSTRNKRKRTLDQSSQTSPLQLSSAPVHNTESYLTSIIKGSPQATIRTTGEKIAENSTSNKMKRKLDHNSPESPLRLHTIPVHHQSPSSSKHTIFDNEANETDEVPKEKKKKHEKNAEKSFLVPSSLLTQVAKGDGTLLKTVIRGCSSHVSSSNLVFEEASKASNSSNSTSSNGSSEYENEEVPRNESGIRPLRLKVNVSSSRTLICPNKADANEVKKETTILPPKRLVQTATGTPVAKLRVVRPKKAKAKSAADSDEVPAAPRNKVFVSKGSKSAKATEKEESLSETVASIKEATSSKIHSIFSDVDDSEEEESFSQVVDSIKKSSSKLESLFSPKPNTPSASVEYKKEGIGATTICSSFKPARAKSVSKSLAQPLLPNEEGLNSVSDEWETTVGKVRGSAQGDDTEAQENIAFSSTYIASRGTGIKISNTTFRVHNLRHAEGWIVSSQDLTEWENGNSRSAFILKICTVISGRVQVRLGKEGFGIGKGGIFRVRSGEECVVRNGERKGAVLWVVCVE